MSYGYLLSPKLTDVVNTTWETQITWEEYLKTQCEVRGTSEVCTYYGHTNCNYIVFKGRVLQNFGYHGQVLFELLQDSKKRKNWLRNVRQVNTTIYHLKRALNKESE
jgi:hypothetical protein